MNTINIKIIENKINITTTLNGGTGITFKTNPLTVLLVTRAGTSTTGTATAGTATATATAGRGTAASELSLGVGDIDIHGELVVARGTTDIYGELTLELGFGLHSATLDTATLEEDLLAMFVVPGASLSIPAAVRIDEYSTCIAHLTKNINVTHDVGIEAAFNMLETSGIPTASNIVDNATFSVVRIALTDSELATNDIQTAVDALSELSADAIAAAVASFVSASSASAVVSAKNRNVLALTNEKINILGITNQALLTLFVSKWAEKLGKPLTALQVNNITTFATGVYTLMSNAESEQNVDITKIYSAALNKLNQTPSSYEIPTDKEIQAADPIPLPGKPPVFTNTVSEYIIYKDISRTLDLSTISNHPDGDMIIFSASISNTDVLSFDINKKILTFKGLSFGKSDITIVATSNGKSVSKVLSMEVVESYQIPDAIFRQKLINTYGLGISASDFDNNNNIAKTKLENITSLNLSSDGTVDDMINDLSGIEGFSALTQLLCTRNSFNSIDISKLGKLTNLSVSVDTTHSPLENTQFAITFANPPSTDNKTKLGTLDTNGVYTSNGTIGIDQISHDGIFIKYYIENIQDAPLVVTELNDLYRPVMISPETIDISGKFADYEDSLTYSVSSSDDSIVTASISGTDLTLNYLALGNVNITVTASGGNNSVDDVFSVNVVNQEAFENYYKPILSGDQTLNIEINSTYIDAGASNSTMSGTVDTTTLGTYSVSHTVTVAGLDISAVRTVNVKPLFQTVLDEISTLTDLLNVMNKINVQEGWNVVIPKTDGYINGDIVNGSICEYVNNKFNYISNNYLLANKQYWIKCNSAGELTSFNGVEIRNVDNHPDNNFKFTIQNIKADNNILITSENFLSEFIFKCEILTKDNQSLDPPSFADTSNAQIHLQNDSISINGIKEADFSNPTLAFSKILIDRKYFYSNELLNAFINYNLINSTYADSLDNSLVGDASSNTSIEIGFTFALQGQSPYYNLAAAVATYAAQYNDILFLKIQYTDGV